MMDDVDPKRAPDYGKAVREMLGMPEPLPSSYLRALLFPPVAAKPDDEEGEAP